MENFDEKARKMEPDSSAWVSLGALLFKDNFI